MYERLGIPSGVLGLPFVTPVCHPNGSKVSHVFTIVSNYDIERLPSKDVMLRISGFLHHQSRCGYLDALHWDWAKDMSDPDD